MLNKIMSSVSSATTSDFVYSSLGFYGEQRGGELPGAWFVEALGAIGVGETTVRQTLYRMERSGALTGRRVGRAKLYGPTPPTRTIIRTGASRILDPPAEEPWDGAWTLVRFLLDRRDRNARDQLRDVLRVEGFASLGPGLYVHPRTRSERILDTARALGLASSVHVFRGERIAGPERQRLVDQLWDLPATADRYRRFIARFEPLAGDAAGLDPRSAFAVRFALVFEYLRITWTDPELPSDLLPPDWPAASARQLAARLYRVLLPASVRFGDDVMAEVRVAGWAPRPVPSFGEEKSRSSGGRRG